MRILSISRGGREIATARATQPMMLIGRSPVCDIVLRAAGVKPVHFLLEWVGTGEFSAQENEWTIIDISETAEGHEKTVRTQSSGEGRMLTEAAVQVGDFSFAWREDRLLETPLEHRALREGFQQNLRNVVKSAESYQLEVVTIREDSESVSHVFHEDQPRGRRREINFPHLPQVRVHWGGGRQSDDNAPVRIDVSQMGDARVFEHGRELKLDTGHSPSTVELRPGGLMQVQWRLHQHYFRLVPAIEVPPAERTIVAEPFYRVLAGGLVAAIILIGIGSSIKFEEPPAPPPPRIAKVEPSAIEIKEAAKLPPPPPPAAVAEPNIAPSAQANVADHSAGATNQKPNPQAATQPGLNTAAEKGDVNSVGLLGALKPRKKNTITADRVLDKGLLSHTASGEAGAVVVKQPPAGTLARANEQGDDAKQLEGAFTTLNVKDAANGAVKQPASVASASGQHDGSDYSISKVAEKEFATEGGLDKESVRRTILAYRKDIRTCYERALVGQPRIQGRVVYKWQITAAGHVQWIDIATSTLDSLKLSLCVKDVIKTIQFPQAANKQPTVVIYPFEFQPRN